MATLVAYLRAVHAYSGAGQGRLADGLLELVKGKVKKKRSPMSVAGRASRSRDHGRGL